MKKLIKIFVLLFVVILLTGCGKKPSKTCTFTQDNSDLGYKMESTYKIYGDKTNIKTIELKEVVTSEDDNILEYYEEYFNTNYETYNTNYGGYENKVTKDTNKVESNTKINYEELDMEKYLEDNEIMKSYVDSNNKFLLDNVVAYYEALGATCK